jgi:hypothetical protein
MSESRAKVIFANDSEVAAVATRFFEFIEYHVKRRCRCQTDAACRAKMRQLVRYGLDAMKWEP